jgi:hypothetical protein
MISNRPFSVQAPTLEDIEAARERIAGSALR